MTPTEEAVTWLREFLEGTMDAEDMDGRSVLATAPQCVRDFLRSPPEESA